MQWFGGILSKPHLSVAFPLLFLQEEAPGLAPAPPRVPGLPSPSWVFKAWPGPLLCTVTMGLQLENSQEGSGLWRQSCRIAVAFSCKPKWQALPRSKDFLLRGPLSLWRGSRYPGEHSPPTSAQHEGSSPWGVPSHFPLKG